MSMNWYKKAREKERHIHHRKANAIHKESDRLRGATHQCKVDRCKNGYKKQPCGRVHKVKGEVMPTMIVSNTRLAKSLKHLNGKPIRGESMKVAIIYELT